MKSNGPTSFIYRVRVHDFRKCLHNMSSPLWTQNKRDYASPPNRNKYNNLPLGQHKSFNYKTNANKHFKTQYDPKVFASDKLEYIDKMHNIQQALTIK
jgi:hypothetical protein